MAVVINGLRPTEPGLEFYRVAPGGATEVAIRGDDRIRVIDRYGGQTAALAARGGAGLAALGLERETTNGGLTLFGPDSRPGSEIEITAQDATTLIVAAPGGRIVDGDPPATELLVEIRRANPTTRDEPPLPPPLAEPRLDFRVDKASALSYEVKQGEYIQVIDVQGRQCSDFLAFHAAKLQQGLERGLDATVTRTLMGRAYPTPGLQGKFYDLDMEPLVEVIRDTVGRHDTFALACQAKYYEDLGYPGHVNCTDNFNGALDRYTIAPRKGWEALNFFYNTTFDSNMQLVSDEPWSRPGDYVMLRAMTDLVCASSACPDDVDPSNAWEVTDVHVRVYTPQNRFSVAIAHRVTADAPPVLTQETAFHPRTSALTKSFLEYRGYWLPHCFNNEGGIAEYWACRERVVVMDLSPLRKFEVLGPDAETLIQKTITRDARKLSVGQVVYTAFCNETGGMIDDATVFRLGDNNFRFVGGDPYDGVWLREVADKHNLKVWIKPTTDQLHNLAVQGPLSRDTLKEIVWTPPTQPGLDELKWFRFLVGRINTHDGIPIIVSRTGYTGELGYEVWCHPNDGPAVWDAIWDAGRTAPDQAARPRGARHAPDRVRPDLRRLRVRRPGRPVRGGHRFHGRARENDEDFIGRDALIERKEHPQRKLVGLELDSNETAGHGDPVYVGRQKVGVVTSGTRSPTLKRSIALCRMAVQYAEIGTEVEVGKLDGLQKRIPSTVVRIPFYDPEKTRPRS